MASDLGKKPGMSLHVLQFLEALHDMIGHGLLKAKHGSKAPALAERMKTGNTYRTTQLLVDWHLDPDELALVARTLGLDVEHGSTRKEMMSVVAKLPKEQVHEVLLDLFVHKQTRRD